jgi:hypothetical protein
MSGLSYTSYLTRMDQDLTRRLIRRRITERLLPQTRAVGVRETAGDGQLCEACELAINAEQRAVLAMVSLEWMAVRFHVECYKLWDEEQQELSRSGGPRPGQ